MGEEDVLLSVIEVGLTKSNARLTFLTRDVDRALMYTVVLETCLQQNSTRLDVRDVEGCEEVLKEFTCMILLSVWFGFSLFFSTC